MGCKRVDFDIKVSDEGQLLEITYQWPKLMFDAEELFNIEGEPPLPEYHPKVLSFLKEL